MAIERDNLHYSFRKIDGYDLVNNFVIACREPGKSTNFFVEKAYPTFKKTGAPLLYVVRNIVEITDEMIETIQDNILNKFFDDKIKFHYSKASLRGGVVDIRINGKIFMRIEALCIKVRKIKQTILNNVSMIVFDEFIINPKQDEKYLKGEAYKFKELYTTNKRDRYDQSKPLKCYFLGNPYSLFNPYFVWLGIPLSKLKLGEFYVDKSKSVVVDYYKMNPLLKEKLLKENPTYQFDEDYATFALEGVAVNDKNIKLGKLPQNYHLSFVFKIDNRFIGIFQNNYWEDKADLYFCKFMSKEDISKRRISYCFDFEEMISGCALFSKDDSNKFNRFKLAMRKRLVAFESVDCYYLVEEIYYNL